MRLRVTVLTAAVVMALGAGAPPTQPPGLKDVMQAKLANARALLEPVVRADFAAIARYVEPLSWISEKEIALWQDAAEPQYTQQATLFLLAVDGLREAAEKKDIDGVALEYTSLVSSCVRCHAHAGSARRASVPSMAPSYLARLIVHGIPSRPRDGNSAAAGDNSAESLLR